MKTGFPHDRFGSTGKIMSVHTTVWSELKLKLTIHTTFGAQLKK